MTKLAWRRLERRALADLLTVSSLVESSAVGATTVYRLETDAGEVLALALPDGEALIVELPAPAPKKRRRNERFNQPGSADGVSPVSR